MGITRRTGGSIAGETERKVMTIREQVKMTERKVMTIREQVKMAKTTEMNEGMTMEGQGEDLMIEEGMMMTGGMMTEGKIAGIKEGMVVMAIEWMEITAERMVMTGDGMVMMIILGDAMVLTERGITRIGEDMTTEGEKSMKKNEMTREGETTVRKAHIKEKKQEQALVKGQMRVIGTKAATRGRRQRGQSTAAAQIRQQIPLIQRMIGEGKRRNQVARRAILTRPTNEM